jgi:hypothetical protein
MEMEMRRGSKKVDCTCCRANMDASWTEMEWSRLRVYSGRSRRFPRPEPTYNIMYGTSSTKNRADRER